MHYFHQARHISSPTEVWHTGTNWGYNTMRGVEPDGCCHCDPQPDSSPVGECPTCHRLDIRKAAT